MLLIQLGFSLPKVNVWRDDDRLTVGIRFGFMVIFWLNPEASMFIIKAYQGMRKDPEWLVNNIAKIRLAQKRGYHKGKAQGQADTQYWRDAYNKIYEQDVNRSIKLHELEITVRTLSAALATGKD
jgi:hypothetical protein